MKSSKFILKPIALILFTLSLQAQADETETMLVSANRSAQSISDIAATVLVIEAEQIEEQATSGIELKALLANLIPSLDVGSQSRTNANQNMRGRSALVMIDGISLNSSRSISRQFDSINPFNIARIEVISGASAMYGGGSTGGIINIITKKGRNINASSETWVSVKSGFNDSEDLEYQVAQAISMNNDRADARLAIAYHQTNAMFDGNGDMVLQDLTQTSSQFVSQLDVMGDLGFNLSNTKRIELIAQYYNSGQDSDYGLDYGLFYANYFTDSEIDMVEGYQLDSQAETIRYLLSTHYSDSDFYNQTLNLQLFYRSESMRFNPFYYTTLSASLQNTSIIGGKLVLTAQPTAALNLVYGADAEFEKFDATNTYYDSTIAGYSNGLIMESIGEAGRYPDTKSTSVAAFLQADFKVNSALILHAGMRYQYTNIKVSDFIDKEAQYSVLVGDHASADAIEGGRNDYSNSLVNVGALYKLSKEQQLWFSFAQGFEIPDVAKYYGQGTYDIDGTLLSSINVSENPLEGIKTNAIELGWRLNQDTLSTQFTPYYSVSDKRVEYNSADETIDVVDDNVRIYGLEAQLEYYVAQDFSVGGHFNYIISETKIDGEWENLSVESASPSKAGAYINWQTSNRNIRLQTTQVLDYKDADDDELKGYNTVDLLTGLHLPIGKMQFAITNLLNAEYDTLWSQRATATYSAFGINSNLFKFEGQGRRYAINYSVEF